MIQVYCDGEKGINQWLKDNKDVEVIDVKLTMNDDGELIMVVYKITE